MDGDTGALSGVWQETSGCSATSTAPPFRVEVTPKPDGSLAILQTSGGKPNDWSRIVRRGPGQGGGRACQLHAHTTMRTRTRCSRSTSRRGRQRALERRREVQGQGGGGDRHRYLVPNCHDEAQYLVQLDKKYRAQGLEIVALDFEEPEQQDELARVKAFMKKYGIEYTYLIAGAPIEMWEKVPQAST